MSSVLTIPRGSGVAYPERPGARERWYESLARTLEGPVARGLDSGLARHARIVAAVNAHADAVRGESDAALRERARVLGERLRREGFGEALVARVFAIVREVAGRTLGMRHYDTQLVGGWVLLNGLVAEMDTGEGKTLTATLPAVAAALAGVRVHVISVNDYLAGRDARAMGPVYAALGLSVGAITHGMSPQQKREAYACNVAYCTNKELVFDYLKDRIALGRRASPIQLKVERLYGRGAVADRLLLQGLCFAIVDEVDSVLIDEAKTPLVISREEDNPEQAALIEQAVALAGELVEDADFTLERRERRVRLTPAGYARLVTLGEQLGGLWCGARRRESLVTQALGALHLYVRDRDYLLDEGTVQIVDEFTGRVLPDRSWEQGLHQMIEAKEGVAITARKDSLARITYQRFFRRYLWLAGMSGTVQEIAPELWRVYRLGVVRVPNNRDSRRRALGARVHASAGQRWHAVVERIRALHQQGRPVLAGTRSVAASEQLSALLDAAGVPHQVLNARQDEEEAAIVAVAGESGRVTVATNMAGRGTDIELAPGAAAAGGLHVIATELHEARRIDRQLYGRCARQGDPGSHEALVSLDDELVTLYCGRWRRGLMRAALAAGPLGAPLVRLGIRAAQRTAERRHARQRRDLLRADRRQQDSLAFAGRQE